ncbi:MAG TPA: hypothetical protein VL651_00275 [Bacteroidia bacterium]|nr:hypothetical protein [Bacteroidia bacterium]
MNSRNRILFSVLTFISVEISAQQVVSKFISDPKTGFKVWDEYYSPDDSISWSGSSKNKMATGNGTLTWYVHGKEVAKYEGAMLKGKPEGKGKSSDYAGNVQEGNFMDGAFVGIDDAYFPLLKKNLLTVKDTADLYVNDGASQQLFYYSLQPAKKLKGTVVLIPSTGERADEAIVATKKLAQLCCDSGLLVIWPSINHHIYFDQPSHLLLDSVFADVVKRYQAPKDKFFVGGFSLGAMLALRYTETANDGKNETVIIPRAVFGADPPVDLADLHDQFVRDTARKFSKAGMNEADYYLGEMHRCFGGAPQQFSANYVSNSIWSRSESDGGNAKFLLHTPLRIYSDPDIDWQMPQRGGDYYDMNAPDQTAMISELIRKGNKQAEYVNALGKGFRPDGTRHPHSWSIIDPDGFVKWVIQLSIRQ